MNEKKNIDENTKKKVNYEEKSYDITYSLIFKEEKENIEFRF